jgi:hypothetical protein
LNNAGSLLTHLDFVKVAPKGSISRDKKLIYIPGMSGTAEDSIELLEMFEGVSSTAMSLRGRGKSTAPDSDFRFAAHVNDVIGFLKSHAEPGYFLHSYSVSTAFVLAALADEECPQPAGLIIGDYPARYSKLSPGWATWFSTLTVGGKPTVSCLSASNMMAIERDSEDKDLSGFLKNYDFPLLVLKALGTSPAPSPMTSTDLEIYQRELKQCKVIEFESDHFFRDRERNKYVQTILDFMR